MAKTVDVDDQGLVTKVQPEPAGERTPKRGPSPREAHRLNTVAARAEEVAARRTAILREALARRRSVRQRERQAAIDASAAVAGEGQEVLEVGWIRASDLIVPEEYQRFLNRERAERYAMKFRWTKFGAVSVNRRPDGTLALEDGQHRVWAAQRAKGTDVLVPAVITRLESSVEEADVFDAVNTERASLNYNSAFRARVHAKDSEALHVMLILGEHGLRPTWPGELRGIPGTVTACRTVEYMIKQGGPSSARAVISLLHEVGGDDAEWYRDFIMAGAWQFLLRYDGYVKRDRVVSTLQRLKYAQKLDEITADHRSGINSSSAAACASALHWLYNYRLKLSEALPPFSVETPSRHSAMVKRHARRWIDRHEKAKR